MKLKDKNILCVQCEVNQATEYYRKLPVCLACEAVLVSDEHSMRGALGPGTCFDADYEAYDYEY